MAPTKRKTKGKFEKTKVGEEVLDIVIPYIHDADDRNSVSLLSRNFYEIDRITRKCLTVHVLYYPNPSSLSKRFPFIESLTLKGPPPMFNNRNGYVIQIAPWIQQLSLEFRCLKELCIRHLVVHDEDLETLARTRGKDLRTLKIKMCEGFSTDGLMHVSKYCNQLRTLCLEYGYDIQVKDETWLHQLALNGTVLERLHITGMDNFYAEELTLLAKNCCNSLISLKIGKCYLSKLGDAFRYAVRLEHFGGDMCDEESELVGFRFPPNMCSLSLNNFVATRYSTGHPFLNHIRKLKFSSEHMGEDSQCLWFKSCPNLEVLYTSVKCGDRAMQVIGKFCKKLRKLTHYGVMTHAGLIALAKGCNKIEYLTVRLGDISSEDMEFVATHLKNLRKFCMSLINKRAITARTLENGIRAMLMGCSKLESLGITLWHGGLTDVGLEYIVKYGANLRSLSLTRIGISTAGLVKLSQGCPRLRKLKLKESTFRQQAVASIVFNMPSLRYVSIHNSDRSFCALTRPDFRL